MADTLSKFFDASVPFGLGQKGLSTSQFEGNGDLSQFGTSPYSSSLQKMVDGFQAPTAITPQSINVDTSSYQAKDESKAALPQFDAMRSRLNSQYSQQQSAGQDAIDRQFAAMGGGPGNGAQAKQTENLVNATANAKSSDTQNLDAQEAQARQQLQQQQDQMAFQSGEATKGRVAQGEEFNAGANTSAQEFNTQATQQAQQAKFGEGSTLAGLNTSWDQAQAESRNNEYNKALSDFQAQHSGGLLGGGGFLGLGI